MRKVLAVLFIAALAQVASANGRDPYSSSVHFQRGSEQNIAAGMTFGLVLSHDGGATWEWMCEKAIGYGGEYDPDYEYTSTGAVFATTFDGLKVMRDGCTFAATPPGMTFVSRIEQDKDGNFYYAASDPMDSKIYKSVNDGATFTSVTPPGSLPNDWWESIETAPSNDAQNIYVYLTGFRLVQKCTPNSGNPGTPCTMNSECTNGGMCEFQKTFLLYKSTDGGTSYTTMSMSGIATTSANSIIQIVGISPVDPNTLYVKVTLETGTDGDSIYKSTDAGASWTKILSKNSRFGLSFLVRYDGSCIAGTREMGAWTAPASGTGCGTTWTPLAGAPHIGCLYENAAHEVWACTQDRAILQLGLESDGYGLMKSTDLTTWTGMLKYEDIKAPVACAVGTAQNDRCIERYMDEQSPWCCLVPQLGITSTAIDCSGQRGCFATVDGAVDAPSMKPPEKGCCETGSSGGPAMFLSTLVAGGLLRRRRRK